jgi:acetyl-CoA carboxylase carboxyl transferase subunit beta
MAWSFRKKREVPAGLWTKCANEACGKMAFSKTIQENANVCPECGHHMKLEAKRRVEMLLDEGSFRPIGEDVAPVDLLRFHDGTEPYEQKLRRTRSKSNASSEACIAGRGTMAGRPVVIAVLDFSFLGGSMGVVVGERVALAAEAALADRAPLVIVSSSGGARMHEGALSLMQMAKTSAAIARLREARIPYVSVLADPCTGVSASFAAQGDVTLAEPGALIGFAGPRVIESTIKTTLPDGFQRSEFLLERGFIDRIVDRRKLREEVASILAFLAASPAAEARPAAVGSPS